MVKPTAQSSRPLHVLAVDDSAVVRQLVKQILEQVPGLTVDVAPDPLIASRKMALREPDVVVLDLEMPRMDGLTFLRRLMRDRPLPVVVCSSHAERGSHNALRALEMGAVEVLTKPRVAVQEFLKESALLLVEAVRAASQARVGGRARPAAPPVLPSPPPEPRLTVDAIMRRRRPPSEVTGERFVALAASTGGTEAIGEILRALPADTCGLVVVQHMPEPFTRAFAERLDRAAKVRVKRAEDGDRIVSGQALIAPGGSHMTVTRLGTGYRVRMLDGPLVRRHRPSADVLFRSVAQAAGPDAVGVILTGMGDDGAQGLLEMREAGAATLAQDEASCVVFGMPKEAIERGAAGRTVSLAALPEVIQELSRAPYGRRPTIF